jgi:putative nucleotidyltransferase with HDIG domain
MNAGGRHVPVSTIRGINPVQVQQVGRDLANQIAELPRLSIVVDRFLQHAGRDTATVAEIADVLKLDPVLQAWVLRQANSGFCKLNRPINTVAEACIVLGIGPVTRLVYAACTRDLLRRRLFCYNYPGNGFWLHGLAVGAASRRLAGLLGDSSPISPEAAQVAGLLHDVGKLLIDSGLPKAGGPRVVTLAEERRFAGLDHGIHSAAIADTWSLPADIILAVALHHGDNPAPQARILALSDLLMTHWKVGTDVYPHLDREPPWQQLFSMATPLGVDEKHVQRWCRDLPTLIAGLSEMVHTVGHGRPPDITSGYSKRTGEPARKNSDRRRPRRGMSRTQGQRRKRRKS